MSFAVLGLALGFGIYPSARAALISNTFTNGGGDNLWLTADNWNPAGSPNNTASDTFAVSVPASLASPVSITGQRTIDALDLGAGSTISITGALPIMQGDVTNNGTIRVEGLASTRVYLDTRNDPPVSLLGSGKLQLAGDSRSINGVVTQQMIIGGITESCFVLPEKPGVVHRTKLAEEDGFGFLIEFGVECHGSETMSMGLEWQPSLQSFCQFVEDLLCEDFDIALFHGSVSSLCNKFAMVC